MAIGPVSIGNFEIPQQQDIPQLPPTEGGAQDVPGVGGVEGGFDGSTAAVAGNPPENLAIDTSGWTDGNIAPNGKTMLVGFDPAHYVNVLNQYPPDQIAANPAELIPKTGKALVYAYLRDNGVEGDNTWAPKAADELNKKYNTNVFVAIDGETLAYGDECVHSAPHGHGLGQIDPNAPPELIWISDPGVNYAAVNAPNTAPSLGALQGFTGDFAEWSNWGVDLSHVWDELPEASKEDTNRRAFMQALSYAQVQKQDAATPSLANLQSVGVYLMQNAPQVGQLTNAGFQLNNGEGTVTVENGQWKLNPPSAALRDLDQAYTVNV